MRSRAKVLFAVVSCVALLALAGAALAAQVYIPAQSSSGPGSGDGQLDKPRRAAIEQSTGNLFVADFGNGRVQVFGPDGSFITSFGEAELDAPFGIAIYESGGETEVYVSDPATSQILRYDSDEAATPSFSVDAGFTSPAAGAGQLKVGDFAAAVAVDPTNGDLWVADPGDDRAQRYSDSGAFEIANDGSDSPGGAFTGLLDVATDSTGSLYAVDSDGLITGQPDGSGASGQSRVERFSAGGAHQLTLGGLHRPATVAVDLATDQVAVSADQDAIDGDQAPSLHVFDSTGAELHGLRMGSATQYTTVHGLAWRSSDADVFSVNDYGYWNGSPLGGPSINRFELADEPTASIDPVAGITSTSADLSGTVNPGGNTTTAHFELSTDGGSSWKELAEIPVCEVASPGDCTTGEAVAFTATGLTPSVSYEVRLVAESAVAAIPSATKSFTTGESAPLAITVRAQRTNSSAVFNGRVNPYGLVTKYHFEYGTSPGVYTSNVPALEDADVGSGTDTVAVSQETTSLTAATTYYYRLVATNAQGTTFGEEIAVSTLAAGQVPPDNYVEIGNFGKPQPGPGPEEFDEPRKLTIHEATGEILVVDQSNNRVQVFQPTSTAATYLTEFGSGILDAPFGIAVDQATGDVYVSNASSNEIVKFNRTEGNPPTFAVEPAFTSPAQGSGPGEVGSFASALAVDQGSGHLWVADAGNKRVLHFDPSGGFVDSFDGSDSPQGAFTILSDIQVDSTGAIVVAREPFVERFGQGGKHQLTIGGDFFGGNVDGLNIAVNRFDQILVGTGYQDQAIDIWDNGHRVGRVTGFPAAVWGWGGLAVNQGDGTLYGLGARHFGCCGANTIRVLVPGARPIVEINPVTTVGPTSVGLSGSINPQAQDTEWHFEYARAGSDLWYAVPFPVADGGSGSSPQPVSHILTNLDPNTGYEVRLVGVNAAGRAVSATESFSTTPGAPLAGTSFAAPRATTTARLNARIDPNGEQTTFHFEYGPDTDYGTSVPVALDGDAGSGSQPVLVSGEIAGLAPGTEYHYRVVAENASGTTVGDDRTFVTRTAAEMTPPERGIELVNQPEKGNQDPTASGLTPDGREVFWSVQTGAPNASSANALFRSHRAPATPQGWASESVLPPDDQLDNPTYSLRAASATRAIVWSKRPNGDERISRRNADGSLSPLHTFPRTTIEACPCSVMAISNDLKRVLIQGMVPLNDTHPGMDPDHVPNTSQVYDVGSGVPRLISRMPDGSVPSCGTSQHYGYADFAFSGLGPYLGINPSGSRAVFGSKGDDCGGSDDLYLRDLGAEETTLISGPPVAGKDGGDTFVRIKDDGSEVIYTSDTRLDPADLNTTTDIYRWSEGGKIECLTCSVADLGLLRAEHGVRGIAEPGVAVSDDFSRLYFVSSRQLIPGEVAPVQNALYVLHKGEIRYVAPWRETINSFNNDLNPKSPNFDMTPDGRVAVFAASEGGVTTDETSEGQYYRYDDADRSLQCVSCVPGGASDFPASGPEPSRLGFAEVGFLSDDGESVSFVTDAPLLSDDINSGPDVYLWQGGAIKRATSGADTWPGGYLLHLGMTPDAETILFSGALRLTGFERDQVSQLYVSRAGSENPGPPTPPAACDEDDCQGPLTPVPPLGAPGSSAFGGPANAGSAGKAKRCGKGRRTVRRGGKARCVKRQAKKQNTRRNGRGH